MASRARSTVAKGPSDFCSLGVASFPDQVSEPEGAT